MTRSSLIQCLVFVSAAVLFSTAAPSAQSQVSQNNAQPGGTRRNDPKNEHIQPLKEAPELPQLPAYSGKSKFFQGYVQPTERGWVTYQLSYYVKEAPRDVRDWYQNAFNSYQWTTMRAGAQSLSANHKDGHICTVTINTTKEPGYQTQLALFYNQAPNRGIQHN